jgi:hypothetical protein
MTTTNDNDSNIPYSMSYTPLSEDTSVTIDIRDDSSQYDYNMVSFDNTTSTPLSAHNDDTTVTIDMGDVSCRYDYDIASFNSETLSLSLSLISASTIKYGTKDPSLTIPKTV